MKQFLKVFKLTLLLLSAFSLISNTAPVNTQAGSDCPSGYTYNSSKSTCTQFVAPILKKSCPFGIVPSRYNDCFFPSIQIAAPTCPYGGKLVTFASTGTTATYGLGIPTTDGLVCEFKQSTPPPQKPPLSDVACNPVTSYCASGFGVMGPNNYNIMYNPDGFRCVEGMKYLIQSKWCAIQVETTYTCPQGTIQGPREGSCLRTIAPISSSSSSSVSSASSQPANNISFQFATRKGKEGLSNWLSPTNNWAQYNCSSSSTIDGVSVSNLTQYCSQASNYAQSLNQSVVYGFKGLYSYNNGSCVEFTAFAFKINGNWQWRTFEGGNNQGTVVNSWKTTSDSGCPR